VFRLDEHLERLEYSAKAILLKLPWSRKDISDAVCATCRANGLTDGYIRLVITRGVGDLGLSPWLCPKPSIFIIADKIALYPKEHYEKGLEIVTVATRRMNPAALSPAIKSLNYLNNIMAKIEARQAGALEAIMLNDQGFVAECTGDNIFIVHKGRILTPSAQQGALKGITRDAIFAIAKEIGVAIEEHDMTRYDVWNADEVFLTGTGAEVIPVVRLDGREIGDAKPGCCLQCAGGTNRASSTRDRAVAARWSEHKSPPPGLATLGDVGMVDAWDGECRRLSLIFGPIGR
jgi:branched-chain amino acid aminotransferase